MATKPCSCRYAPHEHFLPCYVEPDPLAAAGERRAEFEAWLVGRTPSFDLLLAWRDETGQRRGPRSDEESWTPDRARLWAARAARRAGHRRRA